MKFVISQEEEWRGVASYVLDHLRSNILLLRGDLGAGKTTFTRYLLEALGSGDEVSSPTYAIVNEYLCPKGKIYHFDLYRIKSLEEALDIGIEEYLDRACLSVIEWPDIYEEELSETFCHEMTIEKKGKERMIIFK
ncbi:tRNA (adenosine(37)-N6)-threonylcarbamoyltransferase complex ATPase subunit type 1 TsaE [Riemerella columbipharyngis]|uniref:tRNA threonylcarbamoyladenosine biosynthesis protein TsaE n=1 Tax=Riemerella columbipharyngis TaxID=1071918 RepID=A0A1G7CK65_9FLAO|nr:tRNA (adenosine(37)-N6)-threonylcarbamoyltransferase complex ATPase subunit type 1 TsaE [Riemerella columbipharyngis]SDE39709.1 tRNA threonylcarbamoyladenosine biosynthesis protein TsaE [Riemerella columbipharyngis]